MEAAAGDTPVVLLHGARQTGKTTLAQAVGRKHGAAYFSLDDGATLAAASSDPDGFIAGLPGPVVLDEVQRALGLFLAIKAAVDRDRTPGRFLLTGSANVLMLPRLSESLAGRMEVLTLWPLSQSEMAGSEGRFVEALFGARFSHRQLQVGTDGLARRIVQGGFPEAVARRGADRRSAWFRSYLTTVLQRDVRDLANIEGLTQLPQLLALLATRTAGLLNFSDLSRSVSIPMTTLKRYFALLEATFLVTLVPPWMTNLGLRLVKSPRLYVADTGIAAHLVGADEERLARDPTLLGQLLENFVVMEIRKQLGWTKRRVSMFHYRTQAGREVDVVLEDAEGGIVGVEVKATSSPNGDDFKGLRSLAEAAGAKFLRGVVLYNGTQVVPFGEDLLAVPVAALWSL